MTLHTRPELPPGNLREASATSLLYLLFASTGAAILIPGTLLPSLLLRWSLNGPKAEFEDGTQVDRIRGFGGNLGCSKHGPGRRLG